MQVFRNRYVFFCKQLLCFCTLFLVHDVKAQVSFLHENFSSCLSALPSAWTNYNSVGSQKWGCTSNGQIGNGVLINGYSGTAFANEDWLISPSLNLSAYTNPTLSFWCRTKYSGPFIQVLVSTNYISGSNPSTATWTILPAILPTSNSDVWFLSDQIDLQTFKSQPLHIAFKYLSTTSNAATWRVDEVNIQDGTFVLGNRFLALGDIHAGQTGDARNVSFTMSGSISTFAITSALPVELSKDGINYSTSLVYGNSISGIPQNIYVRLHSSVPNKVYRQSISFSLNGNLLGEQLYTVGSTLPSSSFLKISSWNMKWFGDPIACGCDTVDARIHAERILKDIAADIFCLQEVVDTNKIALLTKSLGPKYAYAVSSFCSFATATTSAAYPEGQKLAFIYNTDKIQSLGSFPLLGSTYPSDTSSNSAYYCFASGRFPFVLKAKLMLKAGLSDSIYFVNIHAKALSDMSSYNRRECGAEKMTDSLLTLFPTGKQVIIGDYNDLLEGSTVSGIGVSPYEYLFNQGYTGITLPSKFPGQSSYVGASNSLIDNLVLSANVVANYFDSTTYYFHEVEHYIPYYANSTSDHFPLVSYLSFDFNDPLSTSFAEKIIMEWSFQNPSKNTLRLFFNEVQTSPIKLKVYNMLGNILYQEIRSISKGMVDIPILFLPKGIYFIQVENEHGLSTKKWVIH